MRLFAYLYDKTIHYVSHPHAVRYLGGLSFAESSFFPIPPDVMLAPMCISKPSKAWFYAFVTTLLSVLGGMFGYLIGCYAFDLISPWMEHTKYWALYHQAVEWFEIWGVWTIFIAGFSPIPYKVFTIGAGVMNMSFIPFMLASAVGRGARFYLVAAIMSWGGDKMDRMLRKYIDLVGWMVVVLAVLFYFFMS